MARRYDNTERRAQASRTKRRILDAAIALIGRPDSRMTIADVARTAGVAVPTVYTHFRTRARLLSAIKDRVAQTTDRPPTSRSLAELRSSVPSLHAFFQARAGIIRAIVHNRGFAPLREAAFRARDAGLERVLAPATAHLSKDEALAFRVLLVRVLAAPSWLELKDEYGLPDDVITRMTSWTVEALLDRLGADARRAGRPRARRAPPVRSGR